MYTTANNNNNSTESKIGADKNKRHDKFSHNHGGGGMDLMLLLLTVDGVAPLKDIFALCISGALRVVARASSDFTFTTTGDRVLLLLLYCG